MSKLFDKVLIANRGEIAVRIARSLRTMGISSAVVHHAIDANSLAVREADEAIEIFGDTPVSAYLDAEQILKVASDIGAGAVHPGYGFLSENGAFSRATADADITFIGPGADVIDLMGDKVASREYLTAHDVPLSPAVPFEGDTDAFIIRAEALGFPLLLKAAAGGGGKGMTIVRNAAELAKQAEHTARQAERYFGDGRIYCERYIEQPRHIEVQIMADSHGKCVHLWERECSIQRRFQKIIEESPAPGLSPELHQSICDKAVLIAKAANYVNAGTVEFILAPDGKFYFLEMNTRLQVEHPVTEAITGVDLVAEQVRVAAGEKLSFNQDDIPRSGHAVECRIYAEDADRGFLPAIGTVHKMREPQGPGIRVDSGLVEGQEITPAFDPMLAKVIAHGPTREHAIARMRGALNDFVLLGVTTNTAYMERLLGLDAFQAGRLDTHFIERHEDDLVPSDLSEADRAVILAAAALSSREASDPSLKIPEPYKSMGRWRN